MYSRMLTLGAFFASFTASVGCDEKLSDVTAPTPNLEVRFSSTQEQTSVITRWIELGAAND